MYREETSLFNAKTFKLKRLLLTTASAIVMLGTYQVPSVFAETIDIAPQDLSSALLKFAQQRHVSIIYNSDQLKGKKSGQVTGDDSTSDILQQLLNGSGYIYEKDQKGNFYIGGFSGTNHCTATLYVGTGQSVRDAE